MRRNSKPAQAVCSELRRRYGIELSGRRLEDYSRAGLLLDGASPSEQADHIVNAGLLRTYRPGVKHAGAKATFVAAAKGQLSRGYVQALRQLWRGGFAPSPRLDPDTDEGNAAIANDLKGFLEWAQGGAPGSTQEIANFVRGLLANAQRSFEASPIIDQHVNIEETPDESLRSGLETVLTMLHGVGPSELESIKAVEQLAGVPPSDAAPNEYLGPGTAGALAADLAEVAATIEDHVPDASEANADELVRGAAWLRQFLSAAPSGVVVHELSDEQLDLLAGQLAPIAVALQRSGFLQAANATFRELGIEPQRFLPSAS